MNILKKSQSAFIYIVMLLYQMKEKKYMMREKGEWKEMDNWRSYDQVK